MRLLILVQQTRNFSMQFTELVYIAFKESDISEIMWLGVFCAHKPYFLMLGHILRWEGYWNSFYIAVQS